MGSPTIFQLERDDDVLIVVPQKNVTSLADADILREMDSLLRELRASGLKRVVFDFGQVSYFGSTMLETMLHVWKQVHPEGGRQALCNVSEIGRDIVKIAHFDTLWPICPSRDDALRTVRE